MSVNISQLFAPSTCDCYKVIQAGAVQKIAEVDFGGPLHSLASQH